MFANTLGYLFATLTCAAITALGIPLSRYLDLANIIMLFLLAVVAVALYLGRGPSIWAAFLSVACFDFFFVPPHYSFTVNDPQYLVTFAVMLAVALVIGQLTARLGRQSRVAAKQERRAHVLHDMAREFGGVPNVTSMVEVAGRILREGIGVEAALLFPDKDGHLVPLGATPGHMHVAPIMASLAFNKTPCTDIDSPYPAAYFPLLGSARVHGVLVIVSPAQSVFPLTESKELLETTASLVALVLDRLHPTDATRAPRT